MHTSTQAIASPRTGLGEHLHALPPHEAAALVERASPSQAVDALLSINAGLVPAILEELDPGARRLVLDSAPAHVAEQWKRNAAAPPGTIARMMETPLSSFRPDMTIGEAIEALRPVVRNAFVTYIYVVDGEDKLVGLVTMRDLLFSDRLARLSQVMLRDPFALHADMALEDAMRATVNRHYPQYPVCDAIGRLAGVVRGASLFELEAFEITAQAGSMVGVEKEERVATPFPQAFRFRNPWLLVNLLTALAAGAVVALFQGTIDRLVILATFLPVLSSQSGNTGCQALAVSVRGITLGDIVGGEGKHLVAKEAMLGLANGAVTGILCGIAMFTFARYQGSPHALMLGIVVALAMVGSCAISGVSGALVPLVLKRAGADPATASSIVVTTATDVASMGLLLGLATLLIR